MATLEEAIVRLAAAAEALTAQVDAAARLFAERPTQQEVPAKPTPAEPKPKKTRLTRKKMQKKLDDLGVPYEAGASTAQLRETLAAAEKGVAPPELDPDPEPEPDPLAGLVVTPSVPTIEEAREALILYVKANGRDAGIAALVECGAKADGPKLSQLSEEGRTALMGKINAQ